MLHLLLQGHRSLNKPRTILEIFTDALGRLVFRWSSCVCVPCSNVHNRTRHFACGTTTKRLYEIRWRIESTKLQLSRSALQCHLLRFLDDGSSNSSYSGTRFSFVVSRQQFWKCYSKSKWSTLVNKIMSCIIFIEVQKNYWFVSRVWRT